MSIFMDLWEIVLTLGPIFLFIAIFWAIVCYGFSMIRLWFKF